ncbi:hypothetical protein KHA80_13830 [Anaerobacillus sp. HL2]|nr:hypothetical protein KHA80_13830 [Anaerobacillus sp. HL2]
MQVNTFRADELESERRMNLEVLVNGVPVAVDPNNEQEVIKGDLFVDTVLNSTIKVKTPITTN